MNSPRQLPVHVSATFTADPLQGALVYWMNLLGLEASLTFAGYGQVLQEALDPSSASGTNGAGGFNVFLVRPSDLAGTDETARVVAEITTALAGLATRSAATHLLVFCPETESRESIEDAAVESLRGIANLEVITSKSLLTLYPVSEPFDPEAERSGKIPFTETMFAALATMLARRISLRTRPPAKVLVLDADNTLWGGIAGEDGPAALQLDGPWQVLREFALTKRESGMLLCLCSKNQESDVDRVFAERADELILKKEDFTGWKVNWNPKSQSIRELADELNLGLDSFVFIDDNPAEIGEVAARCPRGSHPDIARITRSDSVLPTTSLGARCGRDDGSRCDPHRILPSGIRPPRTAAGGSGLCRLPPRARTPCRDLGSDRR